MTKARGCNYNFIMSGAPPDGHERQCRARSRVTRERCKRWALVGSNYCQFHGGRRAQQLVGNRKLPGFYSKYLGPKLSERVKDLLDRPHDEQVALYEELAIARANACEALKLAQPLFNDSKELNDETKSLIISTLNSAMAHVKDLVLAASKLEKEQSDKVSIKVINLIVYQIIAAINEVCGTEHQSIAEAIANAIDEKVRLPLNDRLTPNIRIELGNNDKPQLPGPP